MMKISCGLKGSIHLLKWHEYQTYNSYKNKLSGMTEITEPKERILRLLREDLEFRYPVAGLIRMEEILRKLYRHSEELERLRRM